VTFVRETVEAADPARRALVCISREGERRELSFGELADRSARLAGVLAARGVGRGDVVMTVLGNRPEWAYAMLACWRLGAIAQPCTEQLRPADLRARMDLVGPRAVVADARDLDLVGATGFDELVLALPDPALLEDADPAPSFEPAPSDPALIVFTSGTAGEPKPVRTDTAT
jgi:acyl-coenzyme A synthetase/AMP-(fatty) acid ligase